jgi:prefoldin subunit 5
MSEMTERLQALRGEYQTGRRQLEALDCHRADLRDTLLRIAGAIQVIEELLSPAEHPPPEPAGRR